MSSHFVECFRNTYTRGTFLGQMAKNSFKKTSHFSSHYNLWENGTKWCPSTGLVPVRWNTSLSPGIFDEDEGEDSVCTRKPLPLICLLPGMFNVSIINEKSILEG